MAADIDLFIKNIQKSKLFAQCPNCGGEFSLSKALMFDGRKKFPDKAKVVKEELQKEINDRIANLVELQKKAKTATEKAAVSIGIGKIIEKILPSHKNFNMNSSDCRFLSEPIDMIFFDGLSNNKINHITFMDVKTGKSTLNRHQRQIRDAIHDQNVQWRQI